MYIFTKFTYNEYIGPYFLSHVVLRFSPVNSPRAPFISISGCNSVKSGKPTTIYEQYIQQFHGCNRMENMVWLEHESRVIEN
jgi:hypothetical protein